MNLRAQLWSVRLSYSVVSVNIEVASSVEQSNQLYQQGASSQRFQGVSGGEFYIQEDLGLSQTV